MNGLDKINEVIRRMNDSMKEVLEEDAKKFKEFLESNDKKNSEGNREKGQNTGGQVTTYFNKEMRIVTISDTHNQHRHVKLPKGDMIIHAGDCSSRGTGREIEEFLYWYSKLDYEHKIMIAGNHDFYLEKIALDDFNDHRYPPIENYIPKGISYLNDSGIEIQGIKIWGSPVQPWFYDWAFNRDRGEDINKHWKLIPENTDILITHGPVYGIQDTCANGNVVGCKDLLEKVKSIKPKYFICGHIHEAYGIERVGETTFINASVLDENYKLKNKPIVFDL